MNACLTEIVCGDHGFFGAAQDLCLGLVLSLALDIESSVKEMLSYLASKTKPKKSMNSSL